MDINPGDLFKWKGDGEILEITGKWFGGDGEYRYDCYEADGRPCCGSNGQHNLASNIVTMIKNGVIERIKPLPTKRALIRTFNYGNYYGKRFVVDNVEVITE